MEKVAIAFLALLLSALVMLLLTSPNPGPVDMVECMKGEVIVYHSSLCSACSQQRALLGEAFWRLDNVDCAADRTSCSKVGITSVPSWVIDGRIYVGIQSLEKLEELTGCEAP